MKKIYFAIIALAGCVLLTQCKDYLAVTSPAQLNDEFVTSTVSETFKTLANCYDILTGVSGGGNYNWNDPVSDAEYYPEGNSGNCRTGVLQPTATKADERKGQSDNLYQVISRVARVAELIAQKEEFKKAAEAGQVNDWTQLYGECKTMYCYCYLQLVYHFGDVPFGTENSLVPDDIALTSRFDILDSLIKILEENEKYMYDLGQGGIGAERMSRTFANVLIGECAVNAAGWQTIREDVSGLYGNLAFETKYKVDNKYSYSRRSDYKTYYQKAQTYFRKALAERKGTLSFITKDERSYANNPYQRGFQYLHDFELSPESIWENSSYATRQSERPYSQGRPSNGGNSNGAPCKVFAGCRITPTFYYTGWEDGDKRWDVTAVITGSDGKGNEQIINFTSGSRTNGGIACNKWDVNKMREPYVVAPRKEGMNYVISRMSNVMIMLAEADAMIGENTECLSLLNQLRDRAFGDENHRLSGLSGDALVDAVVMEAKRELSGEGYVKWTELRCGVFPELAKQLRADIKALQEGIKKNGFYDFGNGRVMPAYIWTKSVKLDNPLTYDRDESNPALTPGWRGVYDYTKIAAVASVVTGTNHNIAVKGLFEYIAPDSDEAKALEADGYVKTNWAIDMIDEKNSGLWDYNMLSGIENTMVPLHYHPLSAETIKQSNGNITNGYDLPQV